MSCDYHLLPHPGIQSLKPYIPGKPIEALTREQGIQDIIKLASNENFLGCSAKAQEALARISPVKIASYPSPMNHPLYQKLCEKLGISTDMLILNNGSDALFSLILTTFALYSGKQMVTHEQAFISYHLQAQILGIPFKKIPLLSNWYPDIDAMIAASQKKTALVFLANPNNPTGILIELKDVKRLLTQVPADTIVVLDEAYHEYAYPHGDKASIELLHQYPNLIITRTFSKAYGLAGLRLGYAISSPEITKLLLRVTPPFAVNQAALEAANAALDDEDFVRHTLDLTAKGLHQLQSGLNTLNVGYLPSHCNFITFDCKTNAMPIYEGLLRQGVIVRPLDAYNLPNHLRVTTGNTAQNTRFLDSLARCLKTLT
ncbi:histidinol-phosphate aminotransferase [Legionella lansingensis]|uniref:Histidinol-phosphate aminotransferase n=1 Tax=Legionella lansingensis TaxID=45067 RepID=A0A0W0W082_9GAMM|nr:histidinol-phosphate transaminase [Legionella lansingensis]KTD25788.1 histidinol-phosphate aminotransferase [Legionella lansingensis]SNV52165.1 histidinol-phosphate aminotransferase [Legionella lansingensis]